MKLIFSEKFYTVYARDPAAERGRLEPTVNKIRNDSFYDFIALGDKKDKKAINQRSGDVDGLIKVVQDCLFKKLKADDSAITYLTASKIHSENYNIVIDIALRDINSIK